MTMHLDFRKILIAVDDSPYSKRAVQTGYDLARTAEAEVMLVHVVDVTLTAGDMMGGALTPDIINTVRESGESLLSSLKTEYGTGVETRTSMPDDRPVQGILRIAGEYEPGLIVLGTHGRTGLEHLLMGSVAEQVVRKSRWPVLVVPRSKQET